MQIRQKKCGAGEVCANYPLLVGLHRADKLTKNKKKHLEQAPRVFPCVIIIILYTGNRLRATFIPLLV